MTPAACAMWNGCRGLYASGLVACVAKQRTICIGQPFIVRALRAVEELPMYVLGVRVTDHAAVGVLAHCIRSVAWPKECDGDVRVAAGESHALITALQGGEPVVDDVVDVLWVGEREAKEPIAKARGAARLQVVEQRGVGREARVRLGLDRVAPRARVES